MEHMTMVENQQRGDSEMLLWTREQASAFGHEPVLAKHRLHELDLFSDAGLLDLLEHYPRERLQAFTMGTDPLRRSDWQPVDTTGAGDAFIGGFACFLAGGCTEENAIARANVYAALSTLAVGTQSSFVTRERFEQAWASQ